MEFALVTFGMVLVAMIVLVRAPGEHLKPAPGVAAAVGAPPEIDGPFATAR